MFVSNFRRIDVAARFLRGCRSGEFRATPRGMAVTAGPGTETRCTAPRREGKIEKCHREL
ncbi:hypothetical protein I553_3787 [Mycobacterium xenopi 4042]|uniref:Uncharacterized protein n=1 Tax=Mycobacterium xenopi 4042 TaxID=1299334 RepID=X8BE40_MYCXE|nr:hypothetical protein I553_3787 [Mycobacterium xenopi 4042]